jgi:hypothetical protein
VYAGNRNYSNIDFPNAIYRSTDGGETWQSIKQDPFGPGPGGLGGDKGFRAYVSCLAADPATPGVLYAGLTAEAYDEDRGRGVFRSTDWGVTWQPFPAEGLSNFRIGTLIVDPMNPSRLYAGTGGNGCFRWGHEP